MPTVLQILPNLEAGGAERTAVDVAAALVAAGMRAIVASEGGRLVPELLAAGGEHVAFPAATKNPAAMALNVPRLARLVRAEGVDILHARSRAPAWSALAAARLTGVAFVTTYHGAYNERTRIKRLYNSVMARGDIVIANSEWTARLVAGRHPWAEARIVAIPRGSDLAAFAPGAVTAERIAALAAQWRLPPAGERPPVVLQPTRLTQWKGQTVLVDAMARLAASGTRALTVFAGDAQGRDDYVAGLSAQIAAAGLSDSVIIPGHCTDMPAALALADVVAVPSIEPEAFGRVAVEAQAAGVPVVASDLGATAETVAAPPAVSAAARTGWRVPAGDAAALAMALGAAMALSPQARADLAGRARAHVGARFSLAAMTDATLAVYGRLLS